MTPEDAALQEKRRKRAAYMREWNKRNPDKLKANCKATRARALAKNPNLIKELYAKDKARREADPQKAEARRLSAKKHREKMGPDYKHDLYLKATYGITLEDYTSMLVSQDYRCKLCGKHESQQKNRLHVDHCHATGRIRGILCGPCNSGIGRVRESTEVYHKAADYLEFWNQDISQRITQGTPPEAPESYRQTKPRNLKPRGQRRKMVKRISPEELSHANLMEISQKTLTSNSPSV